MQRRDKGPVLQAKVLRELLPTGLGRLDNCASRVRIRLKAVERLNENDLSVPRSTLPINSDYQGVIVAIEPGYGPSRLQMFARRCIHGIGR